MNRSIREIRSWGLQGVRFLLSILVPVQTGKIMFESSPDYSDNARAFSDYLLQYTNYILIWSVKNASNYKSGERIRFIEKNGGTGTMGKLVFIYHTVSSQFLISTHASFHFANKRKQTYVCCWHGMPLKRIAQWQNEDNKNYLNNAKFILSTSTFYKPILCKCFGKNDANIVSTGYPRNDWLFHDSDVLKRLEVRIDQGEKLIMYLPTFRKPCGGGYKDADKDVFKQGFIDFTSEKGLNEINDFLKGLKIKLIVKPHPAEANQLFVKRLSNVLVVPHRIFLEKDIQLNKVMHYADALVTDFSGAFIDFLNLNRPIGFSLTDIDEYQDNRGFVFDAPLSYMPGKRIYNKRDFEDFCIDLMQGIDKYMEERKRVHDVFNDNSDDNNSYRLACFLQMDINNKLQIR